MGISITDLSPRAQQQVLRQLQDRETKKKSPKTKGGNKLHAQKSPGYLIDGTPVTFASKREQDRYGELAVLLRAGKISDLRFQVRYDLIPPQVRADGKKERGIYYDADFVYKDADGNEVVEDSKGYRSTNSAPYAKFVLKRKLMLWVHGITVHEV